MKNVAFFVCISVMLMSCTVISHQDDDSSTTPGTRASIEQIECGVSDFTFELFKKVASDVEGKSFVLSPLSLAMALAMTESGANGETAAEMKNVLGFTGLDEADIAAYFKDLATRLPAADKKVHIGIANSIWNEGSFPVREEFADFCSNWYDAAVKCRDFDLQSTADEINAWCSDHTNGRIKDMTSSEELQELCMVLFNALYFDASWTVEFPECVDGYFDCYIRDRFPEGYSPERCIVPMLHNPECENLYACSGDLTFVEIPYGNGSYVFDVIIPEKDIYETVSSLNAQTLDSLVLEASTVKMSLKLPKFKLEFTAEELIRDLQAMGMNIAFSGAADFSGISNVDSFIGLVKQKAFIELSEKGTQAAAVSEVGLRKNLIVDRTVEVNRPFIYAIREKGSNVILFIGVVASF